MFQNISQSYDASGKRIFIASEKGLKIAGQLRSILSGHEFEPFYQQFNGGHIRALHAHRPNAWFCTLDIENFFGSIPRNRVAAALKVVGVKQYAHFAKWSTVRGTSGYSLPYGFPASIRLASLVMQQSPLGTFLRGAARAVTVQVYLDDISLSGNDEGLLADVYEGLLGAVAMSGWRVSARKSFRPARVVRLFNCELRQGHARATEERRAAFYAVERTGWAADRFGRYCARVEKGNEQESVDGVHRQ